ncbi:hypothetical protein ACTU3I_14720 [Microbacterium sp. RD1]|uniref:hypothetical protein n=1 Tax=Microbacterium sp. RD1 TaxID=3457313 RepID=UPI003FA5E63F
MTLGRYTSDLEVGDRLEPVRYVMTPFVVREYCHGMDEFDERFHSATDEGAQLAPPTLAHIDKIRLYQHNCPGGSGPDARIHYRFRTRHHRPVPVGAELEARGEVIAKEERRGRLHMDMAITVHVAETGELVTEAWDTVILNMRSTS